MPYKTILVQARADDAGTRAVSVAKTLARMFEAAILGVAAEAFDDTVYGDAAGELIAAERALVENDVTAARKSFHDLTKDWPFGASCVSSPEAPLDVMIRHARGADLIVACRPPGRGKAASDCGPAALVMQTGLPVLLAADGGVELKAEHILVAWRDQREAIRAVGDGYRPRLVFTSSCAAYGAPFPHVIGDDFHLTPLTSYGTQKAVCELLLSDYTRRGFVDGIGLRLPAICVRPGKPNKAASGFYSSIIREPLAGHEAILPVDDKNLHTHASPRAAVGFLIHAAGLPRDRLGARINLTMPGVSCTVAEQIEALRRIAGDKVVARIRREPDPLVMRIVDGWPHRFEAARARALGFVAESSFDEIIRIHIEDELGGVIEA